MPLTDKQQTRLEELRNKKQGAEPPLTKPTVGGLTPNQQARLTELRSKKQGAGYEPNLATQQPFSPEKISDKELLSHLESRLPISQHPSLPKIPRAGRDLEEHFKAIAAYESYGIYKKDIEIDPQRERAYNELTKRGYDARQIQLSLDISKKLKTPRYGRMAGGIVGGIAGAATFGPDPTDIITVPAVAAATTKFLGAATGAGFLGTAGEAIQTGIEEKRLISKQEALSAFATEVAYETGGRTVVATGKLVFSPLIKKTIPAAASLMDDYAKAGGAFSPSEMDKKLSVYVTEGASRGSFGAKQLWDTLEQKQAVAAKVFADNIIDSMAEGVAREVPTTIGQELAEGISRPSGWVMRMFDDLFDPLYKQVDELAKGSTYGFRQMRATPRTPRPRGLAGRFIESKELARIRLAPKVNTQSLKNFAEQQLRLDRKLNGLYLSGIGRTKLSRIAGLPDYVGFSDMRNLRSSFLGDVRQMARDVDKTQGIIKRVAQLTDDAIFDEKATKFLSSDALNLLENTNALYRSGREGLKTVFSEKLLAKLTKNPSAIVAEIFPRKNPVAIREMRIAITKPIAGQESAEGKLLWNKLRQAWVADAVDKSFTQEGFVRSGAFKKIMKNMGDEAIKEMFPDTKTYQGVQNIEKLFDIVSQKPPMGVSLFVRGGQVAGAMMMYNGAKEGDFLQIGAGGVLLIGPIAYAKLALSPTGAKLLTGIFRVKPGSSELVPFAARMVNLLKQINRQEISVPRKKIVREVLPQTPSEYAKIRGQLP